jgi:hypothetical protein
VKPADRAQHERAAQQYWLQFNSTLDFLEPGDEVVGVLEGLYEVKLQGEYVPRLKIRRDDGQGVFVIAGQKRLLAELVRHRPVVGDRIRIRYVGEEKAAPGMSPTKLFLVAVNKPGSPDTPLPPAAHLHALAKELGLDDAGYRAALKLAIGKDTAKDISGDEYRKAKLHFEQLLGAKRVGAPIPRS